MQRLRGILHIIFLLLLFSSCAKTESVRILYLNDFHGFAEPYASYGSDKMLGGIAYLSARANELRKEKPSLLLAAGDM
jgi:2',3'-cyclic-nucleotide 2'-phosphodiesterase (5'-nucleotidase family)